MNNNYISYNLNGWMPVNRNLSYEQKIRKFSAYIKETYEEPIVIMLQEMLAGNKDKFLGLLRCLFPEYELILPAGFDYAKHYKSIMAVTLVRRDALGSYRVVELDTELPNRMCYLIADLNGHETHVINSHLVQLQNLRNQANWYIAERKRLKNQQWELLHYVLHKNKNANVVFAGDMQERKKAANLKKLFEDGYIISGASGTKTVKNSFFNVESCIDHIILSQNQRALLGNTTEILYDNSYVGTFSDHTLLCLCS